mmetsp:Transcript_17106/g.47387  ORF Transcript_17106/g.47387 Transcript_17106/m.47387 type:complete len:354 (-) Transcript_17106:166-1227(-)|eukprot:CAMPEP_0198122162 /NCGR_PEP_ID=MMETSP1442-20131203/34060_1 /TAXON_ID= /ORGANISM="Craspedostauros australis, Strain CCMP3328" /LENGTH=353 /DNA_ID=CAMNT_0043781125 /DNA_START=71 /DNA_END=1132 /DNA_ORIENTATION=+
MSRAILESFAPATTQMVRQRVPLAGLIFDLILTEKTAEQCPEVQSPFRSDLLGVDHTIRSPYLAIYAIVGTAIGFVGSLSLLRLQSQQRRRRVERDARQGGNAADQESMTTAAAQFADPVPWCWPLAFFAFGCMNMSAFFLHNWEAAITDLPYPTVSPHWWAMDTYSTGAFCMNLLLGLCNQLHPRSSTLWSRLYAALQLMGLLALAVFYGEHYGLLPTPLVDSNGTAYATIFLEQWYVLPVLAFGHFWAEFLILRNKQLKFPILTVFLTVWAYIIMALGIFMDNSLCAFVQFESGDYHDMLYVTSVAFLACDLVFVAVYLFLRWMYTADVVSSRKLPIKQTGRAGGANKKTN